MHNLKCEMSHDLREQEDSHFEYSRNNLVYSTNATLLEYKLIKIPSVMITKH